MNAKMLMAAAIVALALWTPGAVGAAERSWAVERDAGGLARLTFECCSPDDVLTFEVEVNGQWAGSVPVPPVPSGRTVEVSFDAAFRKGPNDVRISGKRLPESVNLKVTVPVKTAGLETEKWQGLIDRTASQGGGRVTIPPGRHPVGGLEIRSNVELHLEKGAVLGGYLALRVLINASLARWRRLRSGWRHRVSRGWT